MNAILQKYKRFFTSDEVFIAASEIEKDFVCRAVYNNARTYDEHMSHISGTIFRLATGEKDIIPYMKEHFVFFLNSERIVILANQHNDINDGDILRRTHLSFEDILDRVELLDIDMTMVLSQY